MQFRHVAAPIIIVALLAACSDSDNEGGTIAATTTTIAATTTTISPEALATAYSEYGPHPVGVTTLQLTKGPLVEVWYPAVAGTTGTEVYDVRDYTPPAIQELLIADVPSTFSYPAGRDADVADGAFPVVLFSHGFAGFRVQSTFLTSHLASWGMIVVAPEHPSRDLTNVLAGTASRDRADAIDDLLQSLDLILAEGEDPTSRFTGRIDAEHVAAVGHSAGGGTVLGAAEDPMVDGYVSLASGALSSSQGTTTTAPPVLPAKPSFFMAGSMDEMVPAETVTRPSFELAPSPSLLWIIEGAGHNAFDDFCTFGNGTGIVGVAEASGLGELLDALPQIRALGEDGCLPPAVDVDITFPMITHGATAWLRHLFGIDAEQVGLTEEFTDAFAVPVEIVAK